MNELSVHFTNIERSLRVIEVITSELACGGLIGDSTARVSRQLDLIWFDLSDVRRIVNADAVAQTS